jgi:hypothetical protein
MKLSLPLSELMLLAFKACASSFQVSDLQGQGSRLKSSTFKVYTSRFQDLLFLLLELRSAGLMLKPLLLRLVFLSSLKSAELRLMFLLSRLVLLVFKPQICRAKA